MKKASLTKTVKEQAVKLEELTKKLASAEFNNNYNIGRATKAENEVEQLHSFLDALPNCIARKAADGYSQNAAMTRLAAWLAVRQ